MDVHLVVSTVVTRVTMKNRAAFILVKHAVPFALGSLRILYLEVVESVLLCKLFGRERNMVVEIEVRIARGDPLEIPPHPLLVCRQLAVRRADTAIIVTSRCFRCTPMPLKPSARSEQCGHPALAF